MKINFGKLTTGNLSTLGIRIVEASESGKYSIIENHQLLIEVKKQLDIYNKVYDKLSFSGKGYDVAQADKLRSSRFSALKQILRGYITYNKETSIEEANSIYKIIKQHGVSIDRLSYSEKTAKMNKLIESLDKDNIKTCFNILNILELFNDLKQSQEDFEKIYSKQAEANAELRTLPSASSIRSELEDALRDYLYLLTAMRNLDEWKMLYADINEQVKSIAGGPNKNKETEKSNYFEKDANSEDNINDKD